MLDTMATLDPDELLRRVHQPEHDVEVALVGKYVDLPDAYLSVTEALRDGNLAKLQPLMNRTAQDERLVAIGLWTGGSCSAAHAAKKIRTTLQ